MGFKDPRDPRDPWAFRSTWTGEVRTGYDELWIVIPLISLLVILAFLLILPLMIYKTCPTILNKVSNLSTLDFDYNDKLIRLVFTSAIFKSI